MNWQALHRNVILVLAQVANDVPKDGFQIRQMIIQTPDGLESNGGQISILPRKKEQGQITIKYFAMEREAVILAEGAGHEFAQRIKERCAGAMPAVDCSVYKR